MRLTVRAFICALVLGSLALACLLGLRLDEGPLGEEEAGRRLDVWWEERGRRLGAEPPLRS